MKRLPVATFAILASFAFLPMPDTSALAQQGQTSLVGQSAPGELKELRLWVVAVATLLGGVFAGAFAAGKWVYDKRLDAEKVRADTEIEAERASSRVEKERNAFYKEQMQKLEQERTGGFGS